MDRLVALCMLVACGPSPGGESSTGTGSGSGGPGASEGPPTGGMVTSGETSTGSGSTGDSSGASDGGSTGVPPVMCGAADSVDPFPAAPTCEDFVAGPPGPELAVHLVNHREQVMYVLGFSPQDRVLNYLLVEGQAGGRDVEAPFTCSLDPPLCDELLVGEPEECIGTNRRGPIRIEPGAQHTLVWAPLVDFPVDLPAACRPDGLPAATCSASRAPGPGVYRFLIVHGTECTGSCECEPGESSCVLSSSGAHPNGEIDSAETLWDGQCPSLEIMIE